MNLGIVITLLIQGYIFLFLLGALGWVILYGCNKALYKEKIRKNFQPGLCLVTGLISFITFYAIIKTKGNSLFVLNLVIGLFLLTAQKKAQQQKNQFTIGERQNRGIRDFVLKVTVFYLLLAAFILFHVPAFEGADWVAFPPSDSLWYVDVVEGLKRVGAENLQGQFVFFNHSENLREPYHYFELWLSAGFSELTGTSSFYSFLIIPIVILGVITMVILSDIFKLFSDNKIWVWLISLAIFFGPLKIGSLLQGVNMYHNLPFPIPKYQVFQLFLLGFIYLFVAVPSISTIFILFLPVASVTALVPVGGGLLCWTMFDFWKYRRFRQAIKDIFPAVVVLLCILLFYKINQLIIPFEDSGLNSISLKNLKSGIKTKANIIAVAFTFLGLFFSPLVLLTFFLSRITGISLKGIFDKAISRLLIFTLGGCLAGLCSWLLLYNLLDSSQLFQNFAITSISVFLTFCIIKIISKNRFSFSCKNFLTTAFFLVMVTICLLATFNATIYLHSLSPALKISKVFLHSARQITNSKYSVQYVATASPSMVYINKFNRNEKVYTPCAVLKKEGPSIVGLSITGDEALKMKHEHVWDESFEKLVKATPFIKYLDASGVDIHNSPSIDTYRVEFIKKNKIMYLITAKGYTMAANLRQYLTADSTTDKYSGLSLYLLNY